MLSFMLKVQYHDILTPNFFPEHNPFRPVIYMPKYFCKYFLFRGDIRVPVCKNYMSIDTAESKIG